MSSLKKRKHRSNSGFLDLRTILLRFVACAIVLVALLNLRLKLTGSFDSPALSLSLSTTRPHSHPVVLEEFPPKRDSASKGESSSATATAAATAAEAASSLLEDDYHFDANFSMFKIPVHQWATTSTYSIPLKVYVYDTLPSRLTTDVESCLLDTYTNTVDHVENFKAELGLIYLFRTYPGRTHDPNEADVFVVPYAAEGHCQCAEGYSYNCAQVSTEDMDDLRASLLYLNETTKRRHLFLLAGARAKPPLWSKPFALTTAPTNSVVFKKGGGGGGRIVIPNLEDKAPYQPSVMMSRQRGTDWWTTRRRKYSFSFIYGGRNAKANTGGGRIYREYLETAVNGSQTTTALRNGTHPFYMKRWKSPHDFHKLETFAYYRESVFCPCLPGDLAWQKRFFDAILNGCLPVVLSFPITRADGTMTKSWFLPKNGETIAQTYPFAKGSFKSNVNNNNENNEWEIDYESFVVEIPMTADRTDLSHMLPILESLLQNSTALHQRQRTMQRYATAFTYGMGRDAHQYQDDAFGRILQSVRHYLDHKLVNFQTHFL